MKYGSFPYEVLTIKDLIVLLGLKSARSLSSKASRQKWPYKKRSHAGSPIHLYHLKTLPDNVQIAWASWDEEKYRSAVQEEEQKEETGKPDKIIKAITLQEVRDVLQWPRRNGYYKTFDKISRKAGKGAPPKIYDGESSGLCKEARNILKRRFPNLNVDPSYPSSLNGSLFDSDHQMIEEGESSYRSRDLVYTTLLRERDSIISGLKGEIAELKESKNILHEYRKELKDENKKLIDEKDRRIEEKQFIINGLEEKINQLEIKIKRLEEKNTKGK